MVALQRQTIALRKKQTNLTEDALHRCEDDCLPSSAPQPAADDAQPELVPQPLAMQGPAAVAWKLAQDAKCTEEQIDAVALVACPLQKRFESRRDKTTHLLPLATAGGNHRAFWLGGGGVGKTHTLSKVIEPMAVTYFGEGGTSARRSLTTRPTTSGRAGGRSTPRTVCSCQTPCGLPGCA